jgi:hypothetical protein
MRQFGDGCAGGVDAAIQEVHVLNVGFDCGLTWCFHRWRAHSATLVIIVVPVVILLTELQNNNLTRNLI